MMFSLSSVSSRSFGCIVAPWNNEFEPVQIKPHLLPSWEYQGKGLHNILHIMMFSGKKKQSNWQLLQAEISSK